MALGWLAGRLLFRVCLLAFHARGLSFLFFGSQYVCEYHMSITERKQGLRIDKVQATATKTPADLVLLFCLRKFLGGFCMHPVKGFHPFLVVASLGSMLTDAEATRSFARANQSSFIGLGQL